jgi:glucose/arabinose dehydrogenase
MFDPTPEAPMQRLVSRGLIPCFLLAAACVDDPRKATPTAPTAPRQSVVAADPTTANNVGPSGLGWSLPIGVQVVASGLTSPIQLVPAPGNATRFIVDQIGLVRMLTPAGTLLPQPLLDLQSRITPLNPGYDERGLLGLAFHPSFATNGRFFVFYTIPPRAGAPAGYNHTNVVSEFRATVPASANDAPTLVPGSERVLLQVDHPQGNHNGGTVAFGPDGYLYISIGDGGAAHDLGLGHVEDWYAGNGGGNGQDVTANLLGNILRLDVDGATPYAVPPDNPFVGKPGRDEVWAYGFRNPYRFAFDPGGSRMLLVGDAGQELWEEVSAVVKGGNYGWNVKEGTHCFDAEAPTVVPATCPTVDPTTGEPLRNPVIEFANWKNTAVPERLRLSLTVVGGHVYRGRAIPWLTGRYLFGGAATPAGGPGGRLFVATSMTPPLWPISELLVNGTGRLNHVVKGFGQDNAGEVYVAASEVLGPSGTTGKVFKLVPPTP